VPSFSYDPDGTPATSTDPKGKVTTFGYDALSRLTSVTDGKVTTTTYDALDRPRSPGNARLLCPTRRADYWGEQLSVP
jgi:YD repeat-containing protein